jgi:methionyl-tRNA formyltransferase
VRALAALSRGGLSFTPQPEDGVTYARKIANEEARLDLTGDARALHDRVRGLSPFPGAYLEADLGRGPERVKVLRTEVADGSGEPGTLIDGEGAIACGTGALRLVLVQRAGRAAMPAGEFLRGARLQAGARLA